MYRGGLVKVYPKNYSIMKITKETPLEGFIIEDRKRRIVFELYKDLNKTYGIFKTTEYDK